MRNCYKLVITICRICDLRPKKDHSGAHLQVNGVGYNFLSFLSDFCYCLCLSLNHSYRSACTTPASADVSRKRPGEWRLFLQVSGSYLDGGGRGGVGGGGNRIPPPFRGIENEAKAINSRRAPVYRYTLDMDEWTIKTPSPICRLFFSIDLLTDFAALCLIDFIDWRWDTFTRGWYLHSVSDQVQNLQNCFTTSTKNYQ